MTREKQPKRILIVDDDPVQVKLLEGILGEHGHEITVATEADKGLQIAMTTNPDIIILDVMMPVINGYNFCRLLKEEAKEIKSAIIIVTARDQLEDIEIGMQMGADAYLTKPINTEELLKTIKVVDKIHQEK